jgi:hypothetical protein
MSRIISRAESWETVYQAFSQINFTAFDYDTIKQSIVDYIKLYFPESFNDFIESSEFVALIEVFAYIGELLIYRVDVSSHENFMSVAQRKQNVLRLAKLISYKASRNLPARGLLKITSLNTTQDIYDTRGNSLKGKTVYWNDVNNTVWKDQFLTIFDAATISNFGTVNPQDRVQVDNVLFEMYSLNNVYTANGVIPYTVNANGSSYPMEIVPVSIDQYGPIERRPEYDSKFTLLYGADGFGNDSPTTGFFFFTKQGKLTSQRTTFDGKTPNQYIDLPDKNINDTDLWINSIDAQTQAILNDGSLRGKRSGEWNEVDTTSAQNVIFSYTSGRNRFETETLENDQVRIAFGDGEFANIPAGTFDIWYRTSVNEDFTIPQNAIVDKQLAIQYVDTFGQRQTLTFTVSLINNIQNASTSEDIEHIRRVAPSVYYTQDRMVNAADYNLYPLKDPSILKIRTVNRTYVGESKFSHWHDASTAYENVKIVGNDMSIRLTDYHEVTRIDQPFNVDTIFNNYILPILSSVGFYTYRYIRHITNIRKSFTTSEITQMKNVLFNNIWPDPIWITYDPVLDLFTATAAAPSDFVIKIDANTIGGQIVGWVTTNQATKMIIESPTTKFWSANGNVSIPYDTIVPGRDSINILQANVDKYNDGVLSSDIILTPSSVVVDDNDGLQDITKLQVVSYNGTDISQSGIMLVGELMDPTYSATPIGLDGTSTSNPVWNPVTPILPKLPTPPAPTPVPPTPVGATPTVADPLLTVTQLRNIPPMVVGIGLPSSVGYFSTSKVVTSFVPANGSILPSGVTIAAMGAANTPEGKNYSIQGTPVQTGSYVGYLQATSSNGEVAVVPYSIQVASSGTIPTTSPTANINPVVVGPATANSGEFITMHVTAADPNGAVIVTHTIDDVPDGATPGLYMTTDGNLDYQAMVLQSGVHKFLFQFTNGDNNPNGIVRFTTTAVGIVDPSIPTNPTYNVSFPASVPVGSPVNYTITQGKPNSGYSATISMVGASPIDITGTFNSLGSASGNVTIPSAGVWSRVFNFADGITQHGSVLASVSLSVDVTSIQGKVVQLTAIGGPASGNFMWYISNITNPGNMNSPTAGQVTLDSTGHANFAITFSTNGRQLIHCVFSDGSVKDVEVTISANSLSTTVLYYTSNINYEYMGHTFVAAPLAQADEFISSIEVTQGTIPPGMSLFVPPGNSALLAYLVGNATSAGTFSGTLTAVMVDGSSASKTFTVNVTAYQATGSVTFGPGVHDWRTPLGIKTFQITYVGGAGAGGAGTIESFNGSLPHNGLPGYAGYEGNVTANVPDSEMGYGSNIRMVVGSGAPAVDANAIHNGLSSGASVGASLGNAGYNGGGGGGGSTTIQSTAIDGMWRGAPGGRGGDGGRIGMGGDGGNAQNYPNTLYSNTTGVGGAGGDMVTFVSQAGPDGYVTISW